MLLMPACIILYILYCCTLAFTGSDFKTKMQVCLLQAELADYKAHSPHAARLSPQVYGLGVQQRVDSIRANAVALPRRGSRLLHDPSLAECTFRPQTNFALSQRARPASAPKTQAPPAAFDLSEYEDLLARCVLMRLEMMHDRSKRFMCHYVLGRFPAPAVCQPTQLLNIQLS